MPMRLFDVGDSVQIVKADGEVFDAEITVVVDSVTDAADSEIDPVTIEMKLSGEPSRLFLRSASADEPGERDAVVLDDVESSPTDENIRRRVVTTMIPAEILPAFIEAARANGFAYVATVGEVSSPIKTTVRRSKIVTHWLSDKAITMEQAETKAAAIRHRAARSLRAAGMTARDLVAAGVLTEAESKSPEN